MSSAMPPEKRLLVPATEAAQMLSMGKSTFWKNVREQKLPPPVHIGGLTRWRVSDLQQCLQATAPTSP